LKYIQNNDRDGKVRDEMIIKALRSNPNLPNKLRKRMDSRCFIATASYEAKEVQILRDFRDNTLLNLIYGKLLVNSYYFLSPPIANILDKNEKLRKATKWLLDKFIEVIK
jgi:hypothetical protein